MDTKTYVCDACTTGSIASLSNCDGAEDAMMKFCSQMLAPKKVSRLIKAAVKFQPVDAFWVFTAGPEDAHQSSGGRDNPRYATDFAKYIKAHKLGPVVTCPKKRNTKYHPDTDCQTWLWSPDQAALEKWYLGHTKNGKTIPVYKPKDECYYCGEYYEDHCDDGECSDGDHHFRKDE